MDSLSNWGISTDLDTYLYTRTPWMSVYVSYGGAICTKYSVWWGFEVCWGINNSAKLGDLLHRHSKKMEFRRYGLREAYKFAPKGSNPRY